MMKTAEEYLKANDAPLIMSAGVAVEYMEAYHQQKLEEVMPEIENRLLGLYGFSSDGAVHVVNQNKMFAFMRWFKSLLTQDDKTLYDHPAYPNLGVNKTQEEEQ
jgi:hypothetical protein